MLVPKERKKERKKKSYFRGIISPRSFFARLIARSKAVWPTVASGYAARNAGSCPLNRSRNSSAITERWWYFIAKNFLFFPRIHSGGQSRSGSSNPCLGSPSVQCFTICLQEAALGVWVPSGCRVGTSGMTSPFSGSTSEREPTSRMVAPSVIRVSAEGCGRVEEGIAG